MTRTAEMVVATDVPLIGVASLALGAFVLRGVFRG